MHWMGVGSGAHTYGVVCFILGTAILLLGLLVCSFVIKRASGISKSMPNAPCQHFQGIVVQPECEIADQHFPAMLIRMPPNLPVLTSRLMPMSDRKGSPRMIAIGSGLAVIGYLVQFIGIRAMHWSVSIVQLAAMGVLTIIRTWQRRYMSGEVTEVIALKDPSTKKNSVEIALNLTRMRGMTLPLTISELWAYSSCNYNGEPITDWDSLIQNESSVTGNRIYESGSIFAPPSTPCLFSDTFDRYRKIRSKLDAILDDELTTLETCTNMISTMASMMSKLLAPKEHIDTVTEKLQHVDPNASKFVWRCDMLLLSKRWRNANGSLQDTATVSFEISQDEQSNTWSLDDDSIHEVFALCYVSCGKYLPRFSWIKSPFIRAVGHESIAPRRALNCWLDSELISLREYSLVSQNSDDSSDPDRASVGSQTTGCKYKDNIILGLELLPQIPRLVTSNSRPNSLNPPLAIEEEPESVDISRTIVVAGDGNEANIEFWENGRARMSWLALKFFLIFFLQLCEHIDSVGGETIYKEAPYGRACMSNTTVNALIKELARSPLWKDISSDHDTIMRHSRLIIIPALAAKGLLKNLGPQHVRDLWVPEKTDTEVEKTISDNGESSGTV